MLLLALIVASWILVSLVATSALCLLAAAVKRGSPAVEVPCPPVLPLLVGARAATVGAEAPAVALPAQRRPAASPALTA